MPRQLHLGSWRSITSSQSGMHLLPPHHLVTHGVIVGMTGSGKTGLLTVTIEEALRSQIPVLVIDVKGDLPNLQLAFPRFDTRDLVSWLESCATDDISVESVAEHANSERKSRLETWGIGVQDLTDYCNKTSVRVITPGASAGELLHVLSSLERPSQRWQTDPESARNSLRRRHALRSTG